MLSLANVSSLIILVTVIETVHSGVVTKPLLIESKNHPAINEKLEKLNETAVVARNSEARETRWNYYYIAQSFWHFPLWFLIYFVGYLVFNTVRSIYNHPVS